MEPTDFYHFLFFDPKIIKKVYNTANKAHIADAQLTRGLKAMIECLEGECEIDNNTTEVHIGLFGFYPHNRYEDLIQFFEKELLLVDYDKQLTNMGFYRPVYLAYGTRETDAGHVLGLKFQNRNEAEAFIHDKIKNSVYVNLNIFNEIHFIDATKFKAFCSEAEQWNAKSFQEQSMPVKPDIPVATQDLKHFNVLLAVAFACFAVVIIFLIVTS